jgi:miniconductance mechanosensitive channel
MHRTFLLLCAVLISFVSSVSLLAESPSVNGTVPALMKMGDEATKADLVLELQLTLNQYFRDLHQTSEFVEFSPFSETVTVNKGAENKREIENHIVTIAGKTLLVPAQGTNYTEAINGESNKTGDVEITHIQLPPRFLKVDGIYGKKTFAAVYLFQINENLDPTGEVDAVTLRRLEPLCPTNSVLAVIMNWLASREGIDKNVRASWIKHETSVVMTLLILVAAMIVFQFARSLSNSTKFLSKWLFTPSSSPWFTALRERHVFSHMAHLAPGLFIFLAAYVFPVQVDEKTISHPYLYVFEKWHIIVSRFGLAYTSFAFTWVALAFVNACDTIYTEGQPEENPISGIIRAAKRIVTLVGIVLICGALAGENPMFFVGGLGAFMAVIMLAFRDTILGLVASVQIISNKMVKVGDWIEMPKYGADGDVLEISLTRIKIQNFDKTFTTIPTHAIMSESFRNWTGMQESGGRRIKRSIYIDLNTIKPLNAEMCDYFESISLLSDYIQGKRNELREHFRQNDVVMSPVNGRWLTNAGTYRIYLEKYLEQHPLISSEMTFLVRQLEPTREGLPIEIYAFTCETDWSVYEQIQADIFDHALSVLPEFDLRVFQDPSEFSHEQNTAHRIDHDVTLNVSAEMTDFAKRDLQREVDRQNEILAENPRKQVATSLRKIEREAEQLGLAKNVTITAKDRKVVIRAV